MGAECIEEPSHHLEALDVILKPNLTRHDVSAELGPLVIIISAPSLMMLVDDCFLAVSRTLP